jgi:hypothetical protein
MPRTKKVEETKPVAKKPAAKKKPATKPAAKKTTTKPKATPKPRAKKVEDTQIIKPTDDLSKFPYETFPYRLEHAELKGKKVCWFSHESHVHKYIERHKLTKKDYVAECFSNLY